MPYYGPGMPWYGRGSGHICAAQQELARLREDLEANHLVSRAPSVADYTERQNPPYVGRGGAGNYGDLHELTEESPETSFTRSRRTSQPQSPTYGRGGAGNYAMGAVEDKRTALRKAMDDEQKRQKLQADVEKGVEEQLAAPQKAKVNAGRQSLR